MNPSLKLTEDIAADIRARVKALDFNTIEKINKAKDANGTFDVIISAEVIDRSGETVKQDGWELANYKNNPIVLWGHDYYSLPIGVCTETYLTEYRGVPALGARGVFLSADINPFAQQVRRLYEFGVKSGYEVGCTTSVGFIPKERDETNSAIITRQESLEFSFVPIPANQGVGPAQGRALTFEEAKELGLDMVGMKQKGLSFAETKGYIPKSASEQLAPAEALWSKPTLKDFTDKGWDDLSDAQKRDIASHFAYAKSATPAAFEDLKLPYRRASDGAVVLSGLKAAMASLVDEVEVNGDRKAVYAHLAELYKAFDKEAPAFATLKAAEAGDSCTMDDGGEGQLATDPKDPNGPLICVPTDAKAHKDEHGSQKALLKAIGDEHARHVDEVDKSFNTFEKAVAEDLGDPADAEGTKAKKPSATDSMRGNLKDLRDALRDEHVMHRAKSISCFRAFDPAESKAFDKNPHLKALRDEHDQYESKNNDALDEFEERCMKSVQGEPGEIDGHTDWVTGKIEDSQRVHRKAVIKIAKAMCKDAFGEEDEPDAKMVEILKEYLSPYIDPMLLAPLTAKIGARMSSESKKKLGEAHEHLKAAKAVLEELHGGLGDGDGEEGRSDGSDKTLPTMAPVKQRSRPARAANGKEELDAHLLAREVLRGVTTAASAALERINAEARIRNNGRSKN